LNKFIKKANQNSWKDIEYFNLGWKERIKNMAEFIQPNQSVMDLGCGKMWLKDFLPEGCTYFGVDYKHRDNETIICDFNLAQFPGFNTDIAFVSGCLEYVKNYEWFVDQIHNKCKRCIVSYCITENFPNIEERKGRSWVNHLSYGDILDVFNRSQFKLIDERSTLNHIFVFENESTNN
jgi:hypothetical protein